MYFVYCVINTSLPNTEEEMEAIEVDEGEGEEGDGEEEEDESSTSAAAAAAKEESTKVQYFHMIARLVEIYCDNDNTNCYCDSPT